MMRLASALAAAGLFLLGCHCQEEPPPVKKAPAPSASVAAPEPPKEPATPSEEVTFETADKIPLSGTLYLAKDPTAPLVVLLHRYRGERVEWAPLAARLAEAPKRYTVLNFDLRGHGKSKSSSGKKKLDWADMKPKDMPAFEEDVHAAIKYGLERTEGKARGVVLVGSSLGAAFAARAASEEAKVVALAVVSPGAAIEGYDVYHPFADVRMLPSFIAAAKDDNVAREPVSALTQMAKEHGTVKIYDGRGHGAFGLGQEGTQLFTDLVDWLMTVYDAGTVERTIISKGAGDKKKGQKR
jgi:alpha-beta hydrolase superfamily lysophospholipase